ncbi:MFS transporter [Nocardioides deserti]|uniref:MFS transporter n=1 Tax=Nocardioides deserti TaxID=1588644 RepID=A0ABR6UCM6_9ACTN|nr:MFS transporter [Nocardioides deserti]MBC2962206.1 MFS transporter [Nocardioides deserti]GGO67961.1 MFS transporter [Nocardioides deserti]
MLTALRTYVTPPSTLAGRLSVQSLLFATGDGAFLAGSAVYFGVILGLSLGQVGVGLTVAAIASFVVAVPAGKLVDWFGPKRMWSLSAVVQGALFLAWPFIDGFPQFVAIAVAMEVAGSLAGAAHGAYVLDVLPPGQRVESRAYMYSALNVGFSLGAFLSGGAIAFGADVLRWAPLLTSVLFLVNAVAILRLPNATHDVRSNEPRPQPEGPPAIRNRSWLAVTFLTGVLWSNQVLLHTVIPLWLVIETDAPHELVAVLFATNTVMCIVLPRLTARGIRDVDTALRAVRLSALFFALTCLVTLATHETVGWVTVVLFFVGHIVLTWAELYLSASGWTFEAELMDPRRRGDYQGVSELGNTLGRFWAPAVYGFLAMEWGAVGWLIIAAIVSAAAAAMHPATRAGRRYLEQHVPADVLADARAGAPEDAPPPATTLTEPLDPGTTVTDTPVPR